jgi:hypothetical protein
MSDGNEVSVIPKTKCTVLKGLGMGGASLTRFQVSTSIGAVDSGTAPVIPDKHRVATLLVTMAIAYSAVDV